MNAHDIVRRATLPLKKLLQKEGKECVGRKSLVKKTSGTFMGALERVNPLRRFGWAFLLAWVFCVFYTEVVDGYVGGKGDWALSSDLLTHLFFSGLPVLMSIVTLVVVVYVEPRLGAPVEHPVLLWVAPAAAALSTPLLFWSTSDPVLAVVCFVVGSLLTGFGSGLMWVIWGEYYARISQEDAEFLAPVSAVVAALLVLLVSAMSGWIALVFVATLPLLSGLCFLLSWKDVQNSSAVEHVSSAEQQVYAAARDRAKSSPLRVLSAMGRGGFGIFTACVFVCIAGTFWDAREVHGLPFQMVLVLSIAFMVLVSAASTQGPARISIPFLYRWMCPVLVLGFAALILFDSQMGAYVAFAVSIASRFAFCVITQMFFSRYAASGKATAVQSFGLGWVFVHLGDFVGVVAMVFLQPSLGAGAVSLDQVAAVSIVVLVVATMFVLNRQSFSLDNGRPDPRSVGLSEKSDAARSLASSSEASSEESAGNEDDLGLRIRELAGSYGLTPRETEVFDLLARGRSIPYVRDALFISKETAATHAKHIYAKLEVHSRQELIDLVH